MSSSHDIPSVKTYVMVFAALMVLTLTTVGVSYVELGSWNVVVAILIAVVKASMVALIFMNVRNASPLTKLFVVAGLIWFGIMFVLTFSDYLTRTWTYQSHPWSSH